MTKRHETACDRLPTLAMHISRSVFSRSPEISADR